MEQGIKQEIERLINLRKTTKFDVKSMENIFNSVIGEKMSICTFCAAQIKAAQVRLKNWYTSNIPEIEQVVIQEPAIEKPVGCQSCKNKRSSRKK